MSVFVNRVTEERPEGEELDGQGFIDALRERTNEAIEGLDESFKCCVEIALAYVKNACIEEADKGLSIFRLTVDELDCHFMHSPYEGMNMRNVIFEVSKVLSREYGNDLRVEWSDGFLNVEWDGLVK
jgi:hypothetical protein